MRIHSLEIKNVRGIEHLVLDDLPETGVVVIHGENEAGKSTIVEALDVVLTEKHTAGSSGIRELQPVGKDVSPEVIADISVGEYRFRIAKRWLQKVSYYRLSAYCLPFKDGEAFRAGTDFNDVAGLYIFDRKLRLLVLDAIERVDEIVLASGDGDFDLLLERVRSRGVEAIAYGAPGLTAQSLIRAASLYVPIEGELLLRNH